MGMKVSAVDAELVDDWAAVGVKALCCCAACRC